MNLKIKTKSGIKIESVKEINKVISSCGIEIIDNYSEHPQTGRSDK